MKRDHRGFSLVEIIVVIAIVGILAGVTATMFGQVLYANTKKAVEAVSEKLDSQRIMAMSSEGTQYLYIYHLSDGYYMKVLSRSLDTYDSSELGSGGTQICGNNISILMENSSGTQTALQTENQIIRIVFKRNGTLNLGDADGNGGTNVSRIIFEGRGTQTIKLVPTTGKHIVD